MMGFVKNFLEKRCASLKEQCDFYYSLSREYSGRARIVVRESSECCKRDLSFASVCSRRYNKLLKKYENSLKLVEKFE